LVDLFVGKYIPEVNIIKILFWLVNPYRNGNAIEVTDLIWVNIQMPGD